MSRNKIWIELDKITSAEQAEKQCELANAMMKKLSQATREDKFFVGQRGGLHYCFGGIFGYTDLVENGKWFNLDYLAAPIEEKIL